MKKYIKYLVLLTISLMIIISIANAQPIPIGTTVQPAAFESNPLSYTDSNTGSVSQSFMYDGILATSGVITLGKDPSPFVKVPTASFELNTFTTPVTPQLQFDPGWVDIKMKYETVGTVNDKYRIEYSTDGAVWVDLQPEVTGAASAFSSAIRPWSQVAEPQDGTWSWADIASLRVRVFCTKDLGPFPAPIWDNKLMVIYDVWVTVYPDPLPPTSSTTVSVQYPTVMGVSPYDILFAPSGPGGFCFVDLYVNDVTDMFTYEIWLTFNTTVLTPIELWSYYPWTRTLAPDVLDDANGYVRMAYGMASGTPIGQGFSGNSPFARVYFLVDIYGGGGSGGWTSYGGHGGTTDITFVKGYPNTFLGDTAGNAIPSTIYDGWFSGQQYMSGHLPDPSAPIGTMWHEIYPDYCEWWELTSWEDDPKNPDGVLSPSDQIDMENETGWTYWFHVDQITTTIHWEFKESETGPLTGELAGAEPMEPLGQPLLNPIGSYWHQIYGPAPPGSPPGTPGFCRWFQITSWEDTNLNGEFDPSDQFDFFYFDEGPTYWAHLEDVTTDIVVSQKPIDPLPPPMAEFPLGISLLMLIAPIVPLAYLWRLRKKVTKQ